MDCSIRSDGTSHSYNPSSALILELSFVAIMDAVWTQRRKGEQYIVVGSDEESVEEAIWLAMHCACSTPSIGSMSPSKE